MCVAWYHPLFRCFRCYQALVLTLIKITIVAATGLLLDVLSTFSVNNIEDFANGDNFKSAIQRTQGDGATIVFNKVLEKTSAFLQIFLHSKYSHSIPADHPCSVLPCPDQPCLFHLLFRSVPLSFSVQFCTSPSVLIPKKSVFFGEICTFCYD